MHHFALQTDSLNETTTGLKSMGVEFMVHPTEEQSGLWYAVIKAPDNVRIELIEKSKSY